MRRHGALFPGSCRCLEALKWCGGGDVEEDVVVEEDVAVVEGNEQTLKHPTMTKTR